MKHFFAFLLAVQVASGAQIVLEDFRIEPMSLRLGDSFVVRAQAVAKDVKLGSFLLRTADERKKEDVLPGFPIHASGFCYVAENKKYHLLDNGSLDRDKAEGAFAVEISTRGWKEGRYPLAFFASNRPAAGPFIVARRDFVVTVRGGQVTVEDLGDTNPAKSRLITEFSVQDKLTVRFASKIVTSVKLTEAYSVAQSEKLPGFSYDAEKKKSALVIPVQGDTVSFPLDTHGWPAGAHHLVLQALNSSGRVVDERPFAVKVAGPNDRLNVAV